VWRVVRQQSQSHQRTHDFRSPGTSNFHDMSIKVGDKSQEMHLLADMSPGGNTAVVATRMQCDHWSVTGDSARAPEARAYVHTSGA
jgi:hypothetical protein